ncbi:MAG: GNAT family N-acetyltransferase, partial [Lentisphaeraceae bacterium]|nr:GNAT family N-acetyltransferase [Lentisphaeraceae bacterium]
KKEIKVHIGHAIDGRYLGNIKDRRRLTDYIRMRCYLQKEHSESKRETSVLDEAQEIIPPVNSFLLEDEIRLLDSKEHMLEFKEYSVYCTKAERVPSIMREIARLREVTFREVGEGTGKAFDMDSYDEYYLQLFIWNREKSEIVGAYRIGEVCSFNNRNMLYTNEFYDLNKEFFEKYSPGLEMGRSFVRKEYQRKPYSLMLLWKAICEYVARNPKYRYLFGAVSVSSEYSSKSRGMIANLLVSKEDQLRSKMPVDIKINKELKDYCRKYSVDNPQDISMLVKDIEEDGKDVPVLVKQYMKLGGRFLSFCVDKEFNSTLDGLIVVDLPGAPEKNLKMYMGDNTSGYLEYHRNLGEGTVQAG